MPSMIESLIGSATPRRDNKRIVTSRRPLPNRPRDLFEVFVTLGDHTALPSLARSCDLRSTDPRHMTFITLNRWPTAEELADVPEPYVAADHLRDLLAGREFRARLVRRLCDAYPERPRMLYVRIPRCAGTHFLHTVTSMHALFPPELLAWRFGDVDRFVAALGRYMGRFNLTRTIMITLPNLAPFIGSYSPTATDARDALDWTFDPPPRRAGDKLFTIVRDPTSLVLSHLNVILTALRGPASEDSAEIAEWRKRIGRLPGLSDAAGWKQIGLVVLGRLPLRNPICRALGDGTAEAALCAARVHDLEVADLSLYHDWIKYTWDVEPEGKLAASEQVLVAEDLTTKAARFLEGLMDQDLLFYERVSVAMAALGGLKTAVRGRDL